MPRLARLDAPGILHHVMGLGILGYLVGEVKIMITICPNPLALAYKEYGRRYANSSV